VSKFRRKIKSALYYFGQIKKGNGKKQAAKEEFVIGVVYGVNGQTWQFYTLQNRTNKNDFLK
jgi:hypothetical protein